MLGSLGNAIATQQAQEWQDHNIWRLYRTAVTVSAASLQPITYCYGLLMATVPHQPLRCAHRVRAPQHRELKIAALVQLCWVLLLFLEYNHVRLLLTCLWHLLSPVQNDYHKTNSQLSRGHGVDKNSRSQTERPEAVCKAWIATPTGSDL